MKIAIDIDEVMAEMISALSEFHNERYGTNVVKEDYLSYEIEDLWGCPRKEATDRVKIFAKENGFRNLKPFPGSQEAVAQLHKNHEIVIITSRFDFLEDVSREWLDEHFTGLYDELHVTNHYGDGEKRMKSDVCEEIHADVLIEDDPTHVLDCERKGINIIMFDAPWNRDIPDSEHVKRAHTWVEILTLIEEAF